VPEKKKKKGKESNKGRRNFPTSKRIMRECLLGPSFHASNKKGREKETGGQTEKKGITNQGETTVKQQHATGEGKADSNTRKSPRPHEKKEKAFEGKEKRGRLIECEKRKKKGTHRDGKEEFEKKEQQVLHIAKHSPYGHEGKESRLEPRIVRERSS